MIEVSVYKKGDEAELEISGHAGFNPGNDIVCAAASMLGQTFVQALLDMEYQRELCTVSTEHLDKGKLLAYGKANGTVSAIRLEAVAKTIITGFRMLAERFPDHVELKERASPKCEKRGGEKEFEG